MTLLPRASMYGPVPLESGQTDLGFSGLGGVITPSPPPQSYVTRYWPSQTSSENTRTNVDIANFHSATLLESRTTVESGTTGLRTWLASQVLAQYLIIHPSKIYPSPFSTF
jgi:protein-lysine N-methyltransferase EEF2KMT